MLWITLMIVIPIRADYTQNEDESAPSERFLFNDLSVRYDHCRDPQTLNRETWMCECPPPLRKDGDDCVCDECLFRASDESYGEKRSEDLPEYAANFLRQLDADDEEERNIVDSGEDVDGGVASRMLWTTKRTKKRKKSKMRKHGMRSRHKERGMSRRRLLKYLNYMRSLVERMQVECESSKEALPARRYVPLRNPRVVVARERASFLEFLKLLQYTVHAREEQKEQKIRVKKINWDRARILNPRKIGRKQTTTTTTTTTTEGMTFSDSTVANETRGAVHSGRDRAFGALSNLFGTGSMSLGAGYGSAAATAHTGEGVSVLGVESVGAKAFGVGMIGKKASRGSSASTLLVGEGDATATNTQSKKASASATAVATKKVASAGSAAYGSATAAASATPGGSGADGKAAYGRGASASASVSGKAALVVESASVGNPNDTVRDLLVRRDPHASSDLARKFAGAKPKRTRSDFDLLGLNADADSDDDWFDN